MSPSEFWDMTPAEVTIVLNAVAKREARDAKERQALTYLQAQLIGVAVMNPKKFPKFDEVFADVAAKAVPKAQSARDLHFDFRVWAALGGGKVN